jgi:hypothetical protein
MSVNISPDALTAELARIAERRTARIQALRDAQLDHTRRRRHGLAARHARRLRQTSAALSGGEPEKNNE